MWVPLPPGNGMPGHTDDGAGRNGDWPLCGAGVHPSLLASYASCLRRRDIANRSNAKAPIVSGREKSSFNQILAIKPSKILQHTTVKLSRRNAATHRCLGQLG